MSLQIQTADQPAIICRFIQTADRWTHAWLCLDGGKETLLLQSIEGDAEGAWPPSPALQDMSQEDLGHTTAIMGVGMAGKSHYSVSVSVEDKSLVADFACLVKQQPKFLGSTYRVCHPTRLQDGAAIFKAGNHRIELVPRDTGSNPTISLEGDTLTIEAATPPDEIGGRGVSHRWCFMVQTK